MTHLLNWRQVNSDTPPHLQNLHPCYPHYHYHWYHCPAVWWCHPPQRCYHPGHCNYCGKIYQVKTHYEVVLRCEGCCVLIWDSCCFVIQDICRYTIYNNLCCIMSEGERDVMRRTKQSVMTAVTRSMREGCCTHNNSFAFGSSTFDALWSTLYCASEYVIVQYFYHHCCYHWMDWLWWADRWCKGTHSNALQKSNILMCMNSHVYVHVFVVHELVFTWDKFFSCLEPST